MVGFFFSYHNDAQSNKQQKWAVCSFGGCYQHNSKIFILKMEFKIVSKNTVRFPVYFKNT